MKKILSINGLLFLIASNVYSQIEGIVTDKQKIAITNAEIIVSDTTGKVYDTTNTDKRGGYFFKGLKPIINASMKPILLWVFE
jgi:hypothetical protein